MAKNLLYLMAQQDVLDGKIVGHMLQTATDDSVQLNQVSSISSAEKNLSQTTYDALILDLDLSSKEGLIEIKHLLQEYPNLPIVILASSDNHALALECLQMGVQDYIYKNQLSSELLSRIMRYAIERKRIHIQLEQALAEADKKNRQLTLLARTDTLTKLPNRAYFYEIAKKSIADAERLNKAIGVLYFDLNKFKCINDNYGHSAGDQVLVEIANRLQTRLRNSDMIARVGGDEFVVLTHLLDDPVQAYSLAKKINQIICEAIVDKDNSKNVYRVGASIGIATYPEVQTVEQLVHAADVAMYEAKENSHHFACFYTKHLQNKHKNQRILETTLKEALKNGELHVLYQPIISQSDSSELKVEGLCRWDSHIFGTVSPDKFIPIAESAQLGDQLGNLMLARCAELQAFCSENSVSLNKLSINVFGRQFADAEFAERLIAELDRLGIPFDILSLEISENQLIDNLNNCQKQLTKLRALGIKVSLDDFGSGKTALSHLKQLPIDVLKLDRVLTNHIDQNPENQALCSGIIHMAHRLNMKVTAEGIEREEEYETLLDLKCDEFQGYLFGRPMSQEALLSYYQRTQAN